MPGYSNEAKNPYEQKVAKKSSSIPAIILIQISMQRNYASVIATANENQPPVV